MGQFFMILVFLVIAGGAAYFVLGRINPDAQKWVATTVIALLAALAAWAGDLIDKITPGG